MDKQEWITQFVGDLMYNDEFLEYAEAMDIALKVWDDFNLNEDLLPVVEEDEL